MSPKMKRRNRHNRLKRIHTQRRENSMFYAHGDIPASAVMVATCTCGSTAFSRTLDPDFHTNFDFAHAYCDLD